MEPSSSSSLTSSDERTTVTTTTTCAVKVDGDLHVAGDLYVTQHVEVKTGSTPKVVTTLPPCESPPLFYSGHSQFLQNLHTHLIEKCEKETVLVRRITVISGLGGIGKSSTALQYNQDYGHHHLNATWFDADTEEGMIQGFMSLAEHFRIENLNIFQKIGGHRSTWTLYEIKKLVSLVYRHFSAHVKKGLFIFDNANQMRTMEGVFGIHNFIPNELLQHPPLILITSRSSIWGVSGHDIQVMTLPSMTLDESLEFVKKVFGLDKNRMCTSSSSSGSSSIDLLEKSLEDLCHLHSGYPLALNLAASRISENMTLLHGRNWSKMDSKVKKLIDEIEVYKTEFETNGQEWILQDFPQSADERYDKMMATVWKGTIQSLEGGRGDVGRMGVELLKLISYLPSISITVKFCYFLYYGRPLRLQEMTNFTVGQCRDLQLAFGLLGKYSMISMVTKQTQYCVGKVDLESFGNANGPPIQGFMFGVGSGRLRVHQLVQKCTRENLKGGPLNEALLKLAQFYAENYVHAHSLPAFQQLLDHLRINGWPSGTHLHHISIAHYNGRSNKILGLTLLSQVYKHLITTTTTTVTTGNLDLCQLAIVYCNNWPEDGLLKMGLNEFLNHLNDLDDVIVVEALKGSPVLSQKISLKNFIDFAMDRMEGFQGCQFAQPILASIFLSLTHSNNLVEYAGRYESVIADRLRSWVEGYAILLQTTEPFRCMDDRIFWTHVDHWLLLPQALFMFSPHKIVLTTTQTVDGALKAMEHGFDVCIWNPFVKSIQYLDKLNASRSNEAGGGGGGGNKIDGSHLAEALACNKGLESTFLSILSRGLTVLLPSVSESRGKGVLIFDFIFPIFEIVQNLTLHENTRRNILDNAEFMSIYEKVLKLLMDTKLPEEEEKYHGVLGCDMELRWSISALIAGFGLFSSTQDDEPNKKQDLLLFKKFLNITQPFSSSLMSNPKLEMIVRKRIRLYFSSKMESKYKKIVQKFLNFDSTLRHDTPSNSTTCSVWKVATYLSDIFDHQLPVNSIPFFCVPSKNPDCVNRPLILKQLESVLTTTATTTTICSEEEEEEGSQSRCEKIASIVIMTGLKGMGKTMTAINYATDHYHQGNLVWIHANSFLSLNGSFRLVAHHFGIDTNDDRHVVRDVYRHFSDHVKTGLFIFDGVKMKRGSRDLLLGRGCSDKFRELQKFLPQEKLPFTPTILVTIRHQDKDQEEEENWFENLGKKFIITKVIHLTPLNEDESVQLLWNLIFGSSPSFSLLNESNFDQNAAKSKINYLANFVARGYPLALNLIASIIILDQIKSSSSGEEYSVKLLEIDKIFGWCKDNVDQFLTKKDKMEEAQYFEAILAFLWKFKVTTILSMEEEEDRVVREMAMNILHTLAFLPKDQISIKFLYFIYHCLPITQPKDWGQFQIDRAAVMISAVRFLEKNSLVKLAGTDTKFGLNDQTILGKWSNGHDLLFRDGCGKILIQKHIQKWTREAFFFFTTNSVCLITDGVKRLVKFYAKNGTCPWLDVAPCYFDLIKHLEWPADETKNHYIYSAYRLTHFTDGEGRQKGIQMLADFSQFLDNQQQQQSPKYQEYFDLVTMILVNVNRKDNKFADMRMTDNSDNFVTSPLLDHHRRSLVQEGDQVSLAMIHDWVLERVIKYEQNWLMQLVGTTIFEQLFHVKDYKSWFHGQCHGESKSRLVQWVRTSFDRLLRQPLEPLFQLFCYVMHPKSVLCQIFQFTSKDIVPIVTGTTEILLRNAEGTDGQTVWFQFFHNIQIFHVWQAWLSTDATYLENAFQVKSHLLDSGALNLMAQCCKDVVPIHAIDMIPVYVGELFEMIQEMAHVDTLGWQMINYVDLTSSLVLLHQELLAVEICLDAKRFDILLELRILSTLSIIALLCCGTKTILEADKNLMENLELFGQTFSMLQDLPNFIYKEGWSLLKDKTRSRGLKIIDKFLTLGGGVEMDHGIILRMTRQLSEFLRTNYDKEDEEDAVI